VVICFGERQSRAAISTIRLMLQAMLGDAVLSHIRLFDLELCHAVVHAALLLHGSSRLLTRRRSSASIYEIDFCLKSAASDRMLRNTSSFEQPYSLQKVTRQDVWYFRRTCISMRMTWVSRKSQIQQCTCNQRSCSLLGDGTRDSYSRNVTKPHDSKLFFRGA